MYEVHPDNSGRWILYKVGDGGFLVVAWFVDREDAEFAREAFETRVAKAELLAEERPVPNHVTQPRA